MSLIERILSQYPIKIILILFLLIVLRAFLIQKSLVLIQRIVAFLMFSLLLLLVMFPGVSTRAANAIGVERGVDLIFYLSHVFLLFLIVALWRRTLVLMTTITKLSRLIALQNPNRPREESEQTDKEAE